MFDRFTVLPIQIFNWMSRPQEEFQYVAAAGMIVLLGLLLFINIFVLWLRNQNKLEVDERGIQMVATVVNVQVKTRENRDCAKEGSVF